MSRNTLSDLVGGALRALIRLPYGRPRQADPGGVVLYTDAATRRPTALCPDGTVITLGAAGSGGTLNHAALTSNLAWSTSGHTGTASKIAGFSGAGAAAEYAIGTDLQAYDPGLASLTAADSAAGIAYPSAANTWTRLALASADLGLYTSGAGVLASYSLTASGRALGGITLAATSVVVGSGAGTAGVKAAARGAVLYGAAGPVWDVLLIGTANKVLMSDGTDISWQAVSSASLGSILTTRGDILGRNATTPARIPLGASGTYLGSDGTDSVWTTFDAQLLGLAATTPTAGGITVWSSASAAADLPIGSLGQVLTADPAAASTLAYLESGQASNVLGFYSPGTTAEMIVQGIVLTASASVTASVQNDGPYSRMTTGTISGNSNFRFSGAVYRSHTTRRLFQARVQLSTVTNLRVWIGMFHTSAPTNVDALVNYGMAFRFSPTIAGDAGFVSVTTDGSTPTTGTAMTTAVAGTIYDLQIEYTSTACRFRAAADGVWGAWRTQSTNLPPANSALKFGAYVVTNTGSAALLDCAFCKLIVPL